MSYKRFANIARVQGSMANQNIQTRLGIISGINPAQYSVKVTFIPDLTETGWIPLLSPWVGNEWGMFCPPSMGDQVEVDFQDGGQNAPICGMRLYDSQNAPLNCPSGEFWLVHKSGAYFKLLNAGGGVFADGHGAYVQLNGDGTLTSGGTWTHNGNVTVVGNTSFSGQVSANGHRIDDTHKHTGVTTGSGLSGQPQ